MISPSLTYPTWLSLHQACQEDAPLDRIRELVEAQPTALRQWAAPSDHPSSRELRLPLHVACESGASLSVIRYLVQRDPSTLHAIVLSTIYTALDFSLYHFHSLPNEDDIKKTKAKGVVNFLADANADATQDSEKQQAMNKHLLNRAVFCRKSKSSKIIRIRLPTTTSSRSHFFSQQSRNHPPLPTRTFLKQTRIL